MIVKLIVIWTVNYQRQRQYLGGSISFEERTIITIAMRMNAKESVFEQDEDIVKIRKHPYHRHHHYRHRKRYDTLLRPKNHKLFQLNEYLVYVFDGEMNFLTT